MASGMPSDEPFIDVSTLRRHKKNNIQMKRGTGKEIIKSGISKLFVSLPVRGSKFSLAAMCNSIRKYIGDSQFRCKKRFSTKGFTSPFEIYGTSGDLQKLFREEIWPKDTILQFTEDVKKLPFDLEDDDVESEEYVKKRVVESRNYRSQGPNTTLQGRNATLQTRQGGAESSASS
jgi:hypothetical protein